MATKVRKQIYLETEQDALLKRLAAQTGQSEAEIIRQAIDRQARQLQLPRVDLEAWHAERCFIADLIEQGPVAGHRTWRREELYGR